MNADEIGALQALTRSLGWKILQREFGRQRDEKMRSIMSPATPPEKRHNEVLQQAGVEEVLGWPGAMIDRYRQEQGPQILRAGVGAVAREE